MLQRLQIYRDKEITMGNQLIIRIHYICKSHCLPLVLCK